MMRIRFIVLMALLALGIILIPVPSFGEPKTRTIHLDAQQFEFMPGRVQVNQGDRVVIIVSALDVSHGFYLDGYGIERRVTPGVPQRIEFVADKAGKFRYRCSVNCGSLHPFMIGELVVGPNIPYWRAVALVLLLTIGMIIYWFKEARIDGTIQQTTSQ